MLSLEGTVCAFNVVYIDAKLQTNRLLCRCLSTTQVRSLDIVQSRKTVRPGFHIVCWYTCSILSETCSFLEVGCTVDECGHFCCYKQREHYRVSEKSPCVCKKHSEPLLCWKWEVFQDVSRAVRDFCCVLPSSLHHFSPTCSQWYHKQWGPQGLLVHSV